MSRLSENHLHLLTWFVSPSRLPSSFFISFPSAKKKKGSQILTPTTQGVASKPASDNYQLLVAVVGSVTVTCVTILLALLALFFIRKTLLNRRRTFTYQSGSVRIQQYYQVFLIRGGLIKPNCVLKPYLNIFVSIVMLLYP